MPPLNKLQKTGLALAISQGLCLSTQAATITVDNSGDADGGCTFREAVASINAGEALDNGCVSAGSAFGTNDTILFDIDAVNGLTSEVTISKSVSINPAGDTVTINSTGDDRVLNISNAASVSINRLVITGGSATDFGGGIKIGGGASLSLSSSTVTNNQAGVSGGGIFAYGADDLTIMNSTISGNTAQSGGGVFVYGSTPSLINSIISNNSAVIEGGGLFVYGQTTLLVSNSTFSGNRADNKGGGIYASRRSELAISNSTVSANTARSGGGAYFYLATLSMLNSTITQNSATASVGGVRLLGGSGTSSTLRNNVIIGNQAASSSSSELYLYSSAGPINSSISQNLIGSQFYDFGLNLQNANIIANADTLPSILSPLDNNGGPTQTHALPEGSPAIDAGDSAVCAAAPISNRDQRGRRRDANCDIGAFEFIDESGFFVIPLKHGKAVVIPE